MKRLFICLMAVLTLLLPIAGTGAAHAGSSQAQAPSHPIGEVRGFASKVEQQLAAKGAYVAIVARVGRDPKDLPKGIEYTHTALWVLSDITEADGSLRRGYRVWNLYQRSNDLSVSELIQDSPTDFFAGTKRLRTKVIVPKPKMQARLLEVISNGTFAKLHNPNYSVLANPTNNLYQNCTEHLLNVVMAALYQTDNMAQIKANTAAYFDAQRVHLSPLKRALGPVFTSGVTMKDHAGPIKTTTFGSISRFMSKYDLTDQVFWHSHPTRG